MTTPAYAAAVLWLAAITTPLVWAAWNARARLLPGWLGAPARLAEVVLTTAGLTLAAELAGALGMFRRPALVLASVMVATVTTLLCRRVRPGAAAPLMSERPAGRMAMAAAGIAVAVVFAQWAAHTAPSLDHGVLGGDSIIYHLPHAARWLQEGSVGPLHYIVAKDVTAFHPSNGELFHAVGMLAFQRDVLSPVLNLGFLAVLLLAGWCAGRRWGAGPACLCAVAVVAALPVAAGTQAGTAQTDAVALGLLLAAVALVLLSDGGWGPLLVGGLAAGLAIGSKLTVAPAVAGLAVVVLALAPALGATRRQAALAWCGGMLPVGSFWFVRNLALAGNPLPTVHLRLGGVGLPSPRLDLVDDYGFSVAHYLFSGPVWRATFLPGLRLAFGWVWPLVLVLVLAGMVAAVTARADRRIRAVAAVAVLTAAAYVFTPTTAYGPDGSPLLEFFVANLRYLLPAVLLGMVVLPIALPAWTVRAQHVIAPVLAGAAALIASRADPWPRDYRTTAAAAGAAAVMVFLVVHWLARRPPSRPAMALGVAAVLVVALVLGAYGQRRYLRARYRDRETPVHRIFAWAQDVRGARIGYVGFFDHYPLYGPDLSNYVQYVGRRQADHSFVDITSCAAWRRAVDHGRYDYLVVMPAFPDQPDPAALAWTGGAAVPLLQEGRGTVFRVVGPLDPSTCPSPARGTP
jgi:hypothetical protein